MIEDFGRMITAVMDLLQVELSLYGVTFTWFQVFAFTAVVGIVCYLLGGAFGGK